LALSRSSQLENIGTRTSEEFTFWSKLIWFSEAHLDLIPITKTSGGPLQYTYDISNSIRLPGAHGEEIVRDMYTDIYVSHPSKPLSFPSNTQETRTTYTCGEDSHIRAWKLADTETMEIDDDEEEPARKKKGKDSDRKERRKEKKDKRKGDEKEKARFKPY
jgi:hypothetical protein